MEELKKTEIPPALEKFIRERIEEKVYSHYPQFIKCINHLNGIKWLTRFEISEQHEFYPLVETWNEKLKNIFTRKSKRLPKYDWIDEYKNKLKSFTLQDAERRIKSYEERQKHLQNKSAELREKEKYAIETIEQLRTNPDYKLYKNYLGEERWLTKEEFENQDEFLEEVRTPKQIILSIIKVVAALSLILIIVFSFVKYFVNGNEAKGYVIIRTNETQGDLYIDENRILGFSDGRPLLVSPGIHSINYRKQGFDSDPLFQQLNLSGGDTIEIEFKLSPIHLEQQGLVRINSPFNDAKVYIDDKFIGTAEDNSQILLTPGTYGISLKKENYVFSPSVSSLSILDNDTINLTFNYRNINSKKITNSSSQNGFIEVKSNINGARIILDGEDTGFKSNYILGKVSLGKHIISLKKEGYKAYPDEKEITLTKGNSSVKVDLMLSINSFPVTVETKPIKGKIFIDGMEVGIGVWSGSLTAGKHRIDFSKEDFYKSPPESSITLKDESQLKFTFFYQSDFAVIFSPKGVLPNNRMGSMQMGYVASEDNSFHADPKNAPEIKRIKEVNESIWQLGYAFTYRNPPENDAILFNFTIPSEISLRENIKLKIWGYRTEETYPLEFTENSHIRIAVNGFVIQDNYIPYYSLDKADDSIFEQFPISTLLHHGRNSIIIATCPTNTMYYALWKIAIE